MEQHSGHSANREATRFPFGLRRPPTLACSSFASRLRLHVRARRSGRVRRHSACRRYGLWPLRFCNDGARLMLATTWLATAKCARLSRSTSLRARNASLGPLRLRFSSATATPPAFGERARKHRHASHAPLAYARSLSASGISGLRAHVANRRQTVQPQRTCVNSEAQSQQKARLSSLATNRRYVVSHRCWLPDLSEKGACDRIQSNAILNQNVLIVSRSTRNPASSVCWRALRI